MDATGKSQEASQVGGSAARKWLLRIVVAGGILVVACVGVGVGGVYLKFGPLRSSEAYQLGLEKVRNDPTVLAQLGEPIETVNWFPGGLLEEERADLHFPVAGPKGRAQVGLQARRLNGAWGLASLEVTFSDGKRHAIDTAESGGIDEAPKWSPGL